jgi:hypothetical protein
VLKSRKKRAEKIGERKMKVGQRRKQGGEEINGKE